MSQKMRNYKLMMTPLIVLFLSAGAFAAGDTGNGTSGGGSPSKNVESEILLLLQGGGLKQAMLNYINTLPIDQMDTSTEDSKNVKMSFANMIKDGRLQADISLPNNYIPKGSCRDFYNEEVPAATQIGALGTEICFDTKKLAAIFKDASSEVMMIKLASLALHEHAHHFQNPNISIEQNERSAYLVSAYVELTAKTKLVPTLEWRSPVPVKKQITKEIVDAVAAKCEDTKYIFQKVAEKHVVNVVSSIVDSSNSKEQHDVVVKVTVGYNPIQVIANRVVKVKGWENYVIRPIHIDVLIDGQTHLEGDSILGILGVHVTTLTDAGAPTFVFCDEDGILLDRFSLTNTAYNAVVYNHYSENLQDGGHSIFTSDDF